MMRAILGGTFDPIHWGHLNAVKHVCELIACDQLILLPSAQPPHRSYPGASAEQRLAMAKLAAQELPNCIADNWELLQPRKSYTQLTLSQFHQRWPHDTLVFIVGEDAFAGLESWYQWQHLLDHAHIVVMRRPHSHNIFSDTLQQWLAEVETKQPEQLRDQTNGYVYLAETPAFDISATAIRNAIQTEQAWTHLVPTTVANYIQTHQLYR